MASVGKVSVKKQVAITPATLALDALGVDYVLHKYASEAKRDFGQEAAEQMQVIPQRIFKTIMFTDSVSYFVAVAPVDSGISPRKLAHAVGTRSVQPTQPAVAQRVSGFVIGGISPFGQKKRQPTVVDESAWNFPTIYVSGGRRGLEIEIAPEAFTDVLGAIRAPISDRIVAN